MLQIATDAVHPRVFKKNFKIFFLLGFILSVSFWAHA